MSIRAAGLLLGLIVVALVPAPAGAKTITIEASGDLLIHSPVWQRAQALAGDSGYAFGPLLSRLRPWVRRADLALCHMETPMTKATPAGYPVFNTPPALARGLRQTGFDACSTASNHTLDRGAAGRGGHDSGAQPGRDRPRRIRTLKAGGPADHDAAPRGVDVALLSYTDVSNGQIEPFPGRSTRPIRSGSPLTLGAPAVRVQKW